MRRYAAVASLFAAIFATLTGAVFVEGLRVIAAELRALMGDRRVTPVRDSQARAILSALAGAGMVVVSAEDLRTYVLDEEPLFRDYVNAQTRLRAALPERTENA